MDRLQVKIEIDRLNQEIKELKAENARYRKALEFYADGENVIAQKTNPEFSEIEKEMELLSDNVDVSVENGYWVKGKRARKALKGE